MKSILFSFNSSPSLDCDSILQHHGSDQHLSTESACRQFNIPSTESPTSERWSYCRFFLQEFFFSKLCSGCLPLCGVSACTVRHQPMSFGEPICCAAIANRACVSADVKIERIISILKKSIYLVFNLKLILYYFFLRLKQIFKNV